MTFGNPQVFYSFDHHDNSIIFSGILQKSSCFLQKKFGRGGEIL